MTARRSFVLVVDSAKAVADSLVAVFEHSGYIALPCYDPAQALTLIAGLAPDFIVTEVALHGVTGIELALAAKLLCPRCKVILVSGSPRTEDLIKEATALGHVFEVLAKPLRPDELLARMAMALGPA